MSVVNTDPIEFWSAPVSSAAENIRLHQEIHRLKMELASCYGAIEGLETAYEKLIEQQPLHKLKRIIVDDIPKDALWRDVWPEVEALLVANNAIPIKASDLD